MELNRNKCSTYVKKTFSEGNKWFTEVSKKAHLFTNNNFNRQHRQTGFSTSHVSHFFFPRIVSSLFLFSPRALNLFSQSCEKAPWGMEENKNKNSEKGLLRRVRESCQRTEVNFITTILSGHFTLWLSDFCGCALIKEPKEQRRLTCKCSYRSHDRDEKKNDIRRKVGRRIDRQPRH